MSKFLFYRRFARLSSFYIGWDILQGFSEALFIKEFYYFLKDSPISKTHCFPVKKVCHNFFLHTTAVKYVGKFRKTFYTFKSPVHTLGCVMHVLLVNIFNTYKYNIIQSKSNYKIHFRELQRIQHARKFWHNKFSWKYFKISWQIGSNKI